MRIQERDIKLIKWINSFGFCTSKQVAIYMDVTSRVANRRTNILCRNELLVRHKVLQNTAHVFTASKKGLSLISDDLPPLKNIRLNNYFHDKALVDLYFAITEKFNPIEIIPDRRIRHNRNSFGLGDIGRVPDCEVYLERKKKPYAFELELSQKSKKRIADIKRSYQTNLAYEGVYYFAPIEIMNFLEREFSDRGKLDPLFKLFPLEEFLNVENLRESTIV